MIGCSHFGVKNNRSQNESVNKTIYSNQARVFTERIRQLRKNAGLNQRQLAERMEREHGMIARIELGERRVDFIECYWLFTALGVDPVREASFLMERISKVEQ
jgi:transcriptional regulator with XRE-family HTH domain